MQLNKAHRDCKNKRERKPYFQSSEWAVNYPPRLLTTSRRIKAVPQSILLVVRRTWEDKETRNWHEIKEVTVKCDRRYTLKRLKWFPVSLRGILQAVLRDSSCKIPALSVAGSTSNNPKQGSELNHTWKISTIFFVERHLIQSQYSLPVKTIN